MSLPADLDAPKYGFRWGNIVVTRLMEITRGRSTYRVVEVASQSHKVTVYVTAARGQIRVFLDGRELR